LVAPSWYTLFAVHENTAPRWLRRWVAVVTACAFGPYLVGGFRTEQIAVYLSSLLLVVPLIGWRRSVVLRSAAPLPFLLVWVTYLSVALLGVVGHANITTVPSGSLAAGLDNLSLPIAMMLLTWFWTAAAPGLELVATTCKVTVWAMTLNAVLAMYSVASGRAQPFTWLPQFWTKGEGGGAVALSALSNGRNTGIFNQPAEAGIAYSLAVFGLLYLLQTNSMKKHVGPLLAGSALVVGGVLTVSKMFLLGGLPVVALMVLRDKTRRVRIIGGSIALGFVYVAVRAFHELPVWVGTAQLNGLFDTSHGGLLTRATAGRLGVHGTLGGVFSSIDHTQPLTGVGASGLTVPYDSAWVEAMVVAGLVGVVLLALIQVLLLARWLQLKTHLPPAEWRLGGAVVLLVIGSSLGLPTLTGNRVSTLCWLLLGLLVTSRSSGERLGRQQPLAPPLVNLAR
jgi:hypothetical protein